MAKNPPTRSEGGPTGMANIQTFLMGIEFPASKQDVLGEAKANNAPTDVMDRLRNLPDRQFHGVDDVTKNLGRSVEGERRH